MEPHVAALETEARGLEGWPAAAALASRAIEEARGRMEVLRALAAEPKDPPRAAAKKGVSASRW